MGLGGSKNLLHEACSAGNVNKVVELMADGENCNEKDKARCHCPTPFSIFKCRRAYAFFWIVLLRDPLVIACHSDVLDSSSLDEVSRLSTLFKIQRGDHQHVFGRKMNIFSKNGTWDGYGQL
jgi:hypothetical protein